MYNAVIINSLNAFNKEIPSDYKAKGGIYDFHQLNFFPGLSLASPIGKIHPFSKIAVTLEPVM